MRRIRDPIHGFIELRPVEAALVETRAFQRLRRIRQLGLTNLVYPGAEHSRFVHSLGACHVAGLLGEALTRNGWTGDAGLARIGALLHDLGHPPFSHAGERGVPHEAMTLALVRTGEVAEVLARHGVDAEAVATVIDHQGDPVVSTIVSGQLDADRMDYLLRDARFCGVRYGEYDLPRLVESVVPAEGGLAVRRSGLHAVEGLLLARYSMFQQVYFHRTRRILDHLLEQVLPELPTDPDQWLDWDDGRVWETLRGDPRPAARALWTRTLPACVAELEVTADPEERAEADAIPARLAEALGTPPIVDSSARMLAFRPDGTVKAFPREARRTPHTVGSAPGPATGRAEGDAERPPPGGARPPPEAGEEEGREAAFRLGGREGDIPIIGFDGRVSSVFSASPVLRRMDPHIEMRRIYVAREHADAARAIVAGMRRPSQLRLF